MSADELVGPMEGAAKSKAALTGKAQPFHTSGGEAELKVLVEFDLVPILLPPH